MARTLQSVGLSVKRVQHRHHRALNSALTELGVSLIQWDALRHLRDNPDASLHTLAQLTFQTDQSFGELALRMVERGLIERKPSAGRAVKHGLTARGRELLEQGDEVVNRTLSASFAPLSPRQLDQLGQLLESLLETEI
jgi:DNA-binding MarR family transcriptional regulator